MSGLIAAAAVRAGRREARSKMVDGECIIKRVTGTVTNPDGTVSKTRTTVYEGECRIQTYDPYERRVSVADVETTIRRDVLQIPVLKNGVATHVKTGDEMTITVAKLDPDLIDREWRLAGPSRKSHQTMRRLYIEEVTQP